MTGHRGRLLGGAVLAVVLLAFFFRGMDWSALGTALREARLLPLLGLVVVTLGVYSARAWRWGDLLLPLRHGLERDALHGLARDAQLIRVFRRQEALGHADEQHDRDCQNHERKQ